MFGITAEGRGGKALFEEAQPQDKGERATWRGRAPLPGWGCPWEAEGPYLMGSDRKHRPQASLTFCQKESAAMALLKVTGIGRSPKWNLQKGTLLAWGRGWVLVGEA